MRHSPDTSLVTLGLASYITPITPKGDLIFLISNPSSVVQLFVILPTGSSNGIILSKPLAIPFIRSSLKVNLSIKAGVRSSSLELLRSTLLASSIFFEFLTNSSAML